jgi:hypothetical protein
LEFGLRPLHHRAVWRANTLSVNNLNVDPMELEGKPVTSSIWPQRGSTLNATANGLLELL